MDKTKLNDELTAGLVDAAIRAQREAYAPYSKYAVGAALLTASGEIFIGVNVENAVFPLTMCAERSAIFSAVSTGHRKFQAIAVATRDGGTPCGSCRQVMAEFGLEMEGIIADTSGNVRMITTVAELLPGAFGSQNLNSGG